MALAQMRAQRRGDEPCVAAARVHVALESDAASRADKRREPHSASAGEGLAQGCRTRTTSVFAILSIHPCLRESKKAQMNPI